MKKFEMDNDLHMIKEPAKNANMNHLRFLRGLAERGVFGYQPVSPPRGEYVRHLTDAEIGRYAMQEADQMKPQALREHIAKSGGY